MASTTLEQSASPTGIGPWPIVGILLSVSDAGIPLIDYPGNAGGPLAAKLLTTITASDLLPGRAVVLVFEDEDPARPVIMGAIADRVPAASHSVKDLGQRRDRDVVVDGERLVLEARSEIVLRCGQGSITLTADGRVVVKGSELVSRSSGVNKIRGALVNIN